MAKSRRRLYAFILFCILPVSLSGCWEWSSEDAYSGGESLPTKTLSWIPPATYHDGAPLNPETDLDIYEIYIKETPDFADTDKEMVALSAIDKATSQVCTTFKIDSLAYFLPRGVTYYISIRAVAMNGMKSDFSQPAAFSF